MPYMRPKKMISLVMRSKDGNRLYAQVLQPAHRNQADMPRGFFAGCFPIQAQYQRPNEVLLLTRHRLTFL